LFAGRKLARAALAIAGFVVGAIVGGAVTLFIMPLLVPVGALVGGVIFALLFFALFRVAAAVFGALGGYAAGSALAGAFGIGPVWLFGALGAIVGGVLGLVLREAMLIVGSGLVGAWLVVRGGDAALGNDVTTDLSTFAFDNIRLLILAALAIVGMLVQFKAMREEG
ncbi:MAG TPA: hypothetical protein VI997_09330, partial [Candidatus Thermoplasmatota archaeon]|nr:hypothetical protein [Candidatus Thermoplasmatota archaeon]